ncbi:cell division protein ZapA [candidate division WOR-3 bacterium]|nr:cell division protein ZapA [candidate division WOR-3 bacterium]
MDTKLKIFGKDYWIKGKVTPEYMQEVADYVNSKFKELSISHKSLLDVAILAALNIADELFQKRELNKKIYIRVEHSIALLEKGLSQS